jgi:hypothetical protein
MVLMTVMSIAGALLASGERRIHYHAEAELAGCRTRSSRTRVAPVKGRDVRLRIRAPRAGWCAGTYKAIVYFTQNQNCPPTINCGGVGVHEIGSTRFTVQS